MCAPFWKRRLKCIVRAHRHDSSCAGTSRSATTDAGSWLLAGRCHRRPLQFLGAAAPSTLNGGVMGEVADQLKHRSRRRPRVLPPLELNPAAADAPVILGDDELDDLVSAAHLAVQASRSARRAERVAELLTLVHHLRVPLEQLQYELGDRLARRPDDFAATDALRVVNGALAQVPYWSSPIAPSGTRSRRRLRRWRR